VDDRQSMKVEVAGRGRGAIPAFVRSTISARSNCAMASMICSTSIPEGLAVSIGSPRERKCPLFSRLRSMSASRCDKGRYIPTGNTNRSFVDFERYGAALRTNCAWDRSSLEHSS
jgi:hypothetical protein